MGKEISYKEAIQELEEIIARVESEEPDVDELSELVTRASELIKKCKLKLKGTEEDLNKALENLE